MNVGDNVLSLKRPKGLICTLIYIRPGKFFVIVPMTKHGYPSTNQSLWEYHHISKIGNLVQANKYPKLYICPKCSVGKSFKVAALQAPLKRISAFENNYQCKKCKEIFVFPEKTHQF